MGIAIMNIIRAIKEARVYLGQNRCINRKLKSSVAGAQMEKCVCRRGCGNTVRDISLVLEWRHYLEGRGSWLWGKF